MSRFRSILQHAHERLDLPQPLKSRVLLEIAADLEDACQAYERQGLGADEALRRATERFSVSDEVAARLATLHRSPLERLLGRFSGPARASGETVGLLAIVLFLALVTGRQPLFSEYIRAAGPSVALLAVAALAGLACGLRKAYAFWIKRDHGIRRLRSGMGVLLATAGVEVAVGIWGGVFGLYRTANAAGRGAGDIWPLLLDWSMRASALMTLSLVATALTLLAWFALAHKAAAIERAELAVLLAE